MKSFHGDLALRAEVIATLDALRSRAIPNVRTAASLVADRPELRRILTAIEAELARSADGLRVAMKHRTRRRNTLEVAK